MMSWIKVIHRIRILLFPYFSSNKISYFENEKKYQVVILFFTVDNFVLKNIGTGLRMKKKCYINFCHQSFFLLFVTDLITGIEAELISLGVQF